MPKTAQQAEARGKAFPLQSSLSLASKNGPAQSDMHMVLTPLLCKIRLRKRDHGGVGQAGNVLHRTLTRRRQSGPRTLPCDWSCTESEQGGVPQAAREQVPAGGSWRCVQSIDRPSLGQRQGGVSVLSYSFYYLFAFTCFLLLQAFRARRRAFPQACRST